MEPYNPYELRKFISPEFHFGSGAIDIIDLVIKKTGAKKVMIVTDPGVKKAGWSEICARLIRGTGIPYVSYSKTTSNPKDFEVQEGAELFKNEGCDIIAAVGGGSSIDCAKGITIINNSGKDINDFETTHHSSQPCPRLICVPTTSGTSSDFSGFAMINSSTKKNKITIIDEKIIPDVTLIDPITTTTMNPELTAFTGMNALVNAFEAYVSNTSSPLTDIYAVKAVNLISHNLIPAMEHHRDLRYRDKMMLGSLYAGLAFSNTIPGIIHSMSHALGGYLDLKYGECNALLLENAVKYNFYSFPERYTDLTRSMGVDTEGMSHNRIKDSLLNEISSIREKAELNYSLGKIGVTPEIIPVIAQNAAENPCCIDNPHKPGKSEIEKILTASL